MRSCEDFLNFFSGCKTPSFGAYFETTFNFLDAHPLEKFTAAETSKFGLSIIFKKCPRHFWRSGLRFSRSTRRALQFEYNTSKSKKIKFSEVIFRPQVIRSYLSFYSHKTKYRKWNNKKCSSVLKKTILAAWVKRFETNFCGSWRYKIIYSLLRHLILRLSLLFFGLYLIMIKNLLSLLFY